MAPTFQFQKNLQGALQVIEFMKEMAQSTWNHCPDQKGIKTESLNPGNGRLRLESLP